MRISDWSSDVCSSDLQHHGNGNEANDELGNPMKDSHPGAAAACAQIVGNTDVAPQLHDVPQCTDEAKSHPADQRSKQNAPADRPIATERRSQPDGSKRRTKADQRNQQSSGLIECGKAGIIRFPPGPSINPLREPE